MNKVDKIFIGLILSELVILGILLLFFNNPCGSFCDTHSLKHPFGLKANQSVCIQGCAVTAHPLTYLIADILILTLLIYSFIILTRFIIRSMKGGN